MIVSRYLIWRYTVLHRQNYSTCTPESLQQFARTSVFPYYKVLASNLDNARFSTNKRPLSLTEKILFSHLVDPKSAGSIVRGSSSLMLNPDRVSMQDASAQTAILQFMLANLPSARVPVAVMCDHLVVGNTAVSNDPGTSRSVAKANLQQSWSENQEVYDFLRSACKKFGFDYWAPGNGIIHQLVLENYSVPGLLMLGTDSHTPNAGGLAALAVGVGGADALDALCGVPWELAAPRIIGVRLSGKLPKHGWSTPKDVALWLLGQLGVRGGTGHVLEYFGDGVNSLSATACATVANMGAEMGATTSIFPVTPSTFEYLESTHRGHLIPQIQSHQSHLLSADEEVYRTPEKYYDRVIDIDLSALEPHVNGPASPDRAIPLSKLAETALKNKWPLSISAALIGSCTNSSYEDMTAAASVYSQALKYGIDSRTQLVVSPGSDQVRATLERDGQLKVLTDAGATILANACGPCIGQWKRDDRGKPQNKDGVNIIVSSFNRNFPGRNDGNPNTMHLLASPPVVAALSLAGNITFNPATDPLVGPGGRFVELVGPGRTCASLPPLGYAVPDIHAERALPDASTDIHIPPTSQRIAALPKWPQWSGMELSGHVLIRVRGKCTTDDISAAGPWLKYKGHLNNIARNTLMTAVNDETGKRGMVTEGGLTIPDAAHLAHEENRPWIVVADMNYGEGSAREHAAMQVRLLGCNFVVARSFARIHETNLKKQGVVPLTLCNPSDYSYFNAGLQVSTTGLVDVMVEALQPGDAGEVVNPFGIQLLILDMNRKSVPVRHSLTRNQCLWIRAGGALNALTQST